MGIKLGNTDINKIYIGNTEINKAYLGSTLLFNNNENPVNYYSLANALSSIDYESADASTGLNHVNMNSTVETVEVDSSIYSLRAEATGSNPRVELNTTLDSGDNYTMTMRVKGDGTAGFAANSFVGATDVTITEGTNFAILGTSYTNFTVTFTTTAASQTLRLYNYEAGTSVYWIDNLIINKTSEL